MNTHAEDLENEGSDDAQHSGDNDDAAQESEPSDKVSKSDPKSAPIRRSRVLIYVTRLLVLSVVFLSVLAGITWYALNEAQRIPEFYQAVLELDEDQAQVEGKQFERNLVRLQNAARRKKPWKIEITQDQVNGWFASDLVEKFPDSLPVMIEDPRAVLFEDEVKLAFRYRRDALTGIVVVSATIYCTDKPNEIAVQFNSVRAGFIPLPAGVWLEKVADSVRKAGIPVFWVNDQNSPIAIFSIPENLSSKGARKVMLDAIEVKTGKIVFAGKSVFEKRDAEPKASDNGEPQEDHPSLEEGSNSANANVKQGS